ncbi:unnamed protein product [Mytilus coruscus]|uniref:CCHC-type domain-containing protein n=1 Tax=Mytilus coruscus TaxID=42192 RepID=A0A6J8E744_MYTCO|nr:unnamed protein product [Mytilus coruscus]
MCSNVDDQASKILLLIKGIELKNYHYKFVDVETEVTNVTIKDAPVELGDLAFCTFMRQSAKVVRGSLKRGTIRGTNIETGTRYIQLINCVPTIPSITKLGRFEIRLFADNNRTQCRYCSSRTDHPSYRCDMKPQRQERQRYCFRCSSHEHIIRNCPHTDNETHCTKLVENEWKKEWGVLRFWCNGTSVSKGIAILVKPNLDINVTEKFRDAEGSKLIVELKLDSNEIVRIFNVYAPNNGITRKYFFNKIPKIKKMML